MLKFLLAIINAGRWLAPPSRRKEWRRQWRADLAHEWRWIEQHESGIGARAGRAAPVAGALRQACCLWMRVRRIEMITQDIRYGWRLMVRKPAFALIAVL